MAGKRTGGGGKEEQYSSFIYTFGQLLKDMGLGEGWGPGGGLGAL